MSAKESLDGCVCSPSHTYITAYMDIKDLQIPRSVFTVSKISPSIEGTLQNSLGQINIIMKNYYPFKVKPI